MNGVALEDQSAVAHVVGFYDADDDLVAEIAAFFAEGFEQGASAIVVATADHRRSVERALRYRGFSIEDLTESGRYRALDARQTLDAFMREGVPSAEAFTATIEPIIIETARAGNGTRIFGEMVALLWDDDNVAAAIELESMWNVLGGEQAFTLYCAYPTSLLGETGDLRGAKQICDQHSRVVSLRGFGPAPVAVGDAKLVRSFVPTAGASRLVRQFVAEVLSEWGYDHLIETGLVVASELATNAVLHGRSPFTVSITRLPSAIEIAVRDASFTPPHLVNPDPNRAGGRGIALVAALATDWGARIEPTGKTVWATLAMVSPLRAG